MCVTECDLALTFIQPASVYASLPSRRLFQTHRAFTSSQTVYKSTIFLQQKLNFYALSIYKVRKMHPILMFDITSFYEKLFVAFLKGILWRFKDSSKVFFEGLKIRF